MPHVFYDSAEVYIDGNKNDFRTIEAQIVQILKNEPRPKFTGSYKKKKRVVADLGRFTSVNGKSCISESYKLENSSLQTSCLAFCQGKIILTYI